MTINPYKILILHKVINKVCQILSFTVVRFRTSILLIEETEVQVIKELLNEEWLFAFQVSYYEFNLIEAGIKKS